MTDLCRWCDAPATLEHAREAHHDEYMKAVSRPAPMDSPPARREAIPFMCRHCYSIIEEPGINDYPDIDCCASCAYDGHEKGICSNNDNCAWCETHNRGNCDGVEHCRNCRDENTKLGEGVAEHLRQRGLTVDEVDRGARVGLIYGTQAYVYVCPEVLRDGNSVTVQVYHGKHEVTPIAPGRHYVAWDGDDSWTVQVDGSDPADFARAACEALEDAQLALDIQLIPERS